MRQRTICGFVVVLLSGLLGLGCPSTSSTSRGVQLPGAPKIDPGRLVQRIHQLINQERRRHGKKALRWDSKLARLSALHSRDMVQHSFFSHTNHRGESPTQRGKRIGVRCRKPMSDGGVREGIAENIFQNNLFHAVKFHIDTRGVATKSYQWNTLEQIATTTVRGWMRSPGHRKNILDPSFDSGGIGAAYSPGGRIYVTQTFC